MSARLRNMLKFLTYPWTRTGDCLRVTSTLATIAVKEFIKQMNTAAYIARYATRAILLQLLRLLWRRRNFLLRVFMGVFGIGFLFALLCQIQTASIEQAVLVATSFADHEAALRQDERRGLAEIIQRELPEALRVRQVAQTALRDLNLREKPAELPAEGEKLVSRYGAIIAERDANRLNLLVARGLLAMLTGRLAMRPESGGTSFGLQHWGTGDAAAQTLRDLYKGLVASRPPTPTALNDIEDKIKETTRRIEQDWLKRYAADEQAPNASPLAERAAQCVAQVVGCESLDAAYAALLSELERKGREFPNGAVAVALAAVRAETCQAFVSTLSQMQLMALAGEGLRLSFPRVDDPASKQTTINGLGRPGFFLLVLVAFFAAFFLAVFATFGGDVATRKSADWLLAVKIWVTHALTPLRQAAPPTPSAPAGPARRTDAATTGPASPGTTLAPVLPHGDTSQGFFVPRYPNAGVERAVSTADLQSRVTPESTLARLKIVLSTRDRGEEAYSSGQWTTSLKGDDRIVGISLVSKSLDPEELEYAAISVEGQTPWVWGGGFAEIADGTAPLIGFAARLKGQAESSFDIVYYGGYPNNESSDERRNGEPCEPETPGAPLQNLFVVLVPR